VFKSIAGLAFVAALSFAGAANAATFYTLQLDTVDPTGELGGVTDAGTIKIIDTGVDLFISIALDNGFEFRSPPDSNHHTMVLNSSTGHVPISNFNHPYFSQLSGVSFNDSPFGTFNNAVDCTLDQQATGHGCSKGAKSGNPTTMKFKVAGITFSDLAPKTYGTKKIYFAVDVVGSLGSYNGKTGNVGATWDGVSTFGVPEPTTWGLMIMGFGFVGAGLRRRRAGFAAA
jgi:hypothetical protein